MQPTIATHVAPDGYRLHFRRWFPSGHPRARIVYLHGIQSHGGWYERSCRALCEAGCDVFFLDRRGSGLNEPDRGHAKNWQQLETDVVSFLRAVRGGEHAPTNGSDRTATADQNTGVEPAAALLPVILLAVSWGGKLAAVVAARNGELVDGLGLLYPAIAARVRPRWDQVLLLKAAIRLGAGRRQMPIPLDNPALFTGSPRWQRFIAEDPLSLRQATLSLFRASHDLDRAVQDTAEQIRTPTLMMLAGRDQIIDNAAARAYFNRLASLEKKLIEYPEAQHTLEFEEPPDGFLADLAGWVGTIARGDSAKPA
jgi:acylglycerol lipase